MLILTERLSHTLSHLPKGQVALFLPDSPLLDPRVCFHTDLRVFAHKRRIICAPSVYGILKEKLPLSVLLTSGKTEPEGAYPKEVPYNGVAVGRFLIANPDNLSGDVLDYAKAAGLTLIPVKQGYCRCNVTVVSDTEGKEAVITEDKGIASAAQKQGVEVLLLPHGGVSLEGWDNGFIGGASVTTADSVLFFGDLALHPEGGRIAEFCLTHGKTPLSLISGVPLSDCGGGVWIE